MSLRYITGNRTYTLQSKSLRLIEKSMQVRLQCAETCIDAGCARKCICNLHETTVKSAAIFCNMHFTRILRSLMFLRVTIQETKTVHCIYIKSM